jgi:MYXO-CTERM domain-containing protein
MTAAIGAGLAAAIAAGAGPAAARAAGAPQVVYLDFSDGTESVTFGATDDPTRNQSSLGAAEHYPAFYWPSINTGVETRAQVISRVARAVHELFLPYNVLVTLARPAAAPYTMVMIGGGARDLGLVENYGGVAYMDCGNKEASNLVFAFPGNLRGNEHGLVVTIAQEAAHAWGLEHTVDRRDVMYPLLSPEQSVFLDEQSAILGSSLCGYSSQNSHRLLVETVGLWQGDEKPFDDGSRTDHVPPTLVIEEPAPGATVAQPFLIRLRAEDDVGIDHIVVVTDGDSERAVSRHPPYGFSLGGLPAGPVSFTLTAYDRSGNTTTVSSQVTAMADPGLPGGLGCATAGPGGGARTKGAPALAVVLVLAALCVIRRRADPRVQDPHLVGPAAALTMSFRRKGGTTQHHPCTGTPGPL